MSKIFFSYRRQDSAGVAGRIYDRLRTHFGDGAIFMDIDSIPFGRDFREHITSALDQCGVLLAVIGHNWAGETGAPQRIDDPRDLVRIEIESALERNLPVIPILIDRANMPGEAALPPSLALLAYRHAIDVDQGRDFHHHVDQLINGIERVLQQPSLATAAPPGQREKPSAIMPGARERGRKPELINAGDRLKLPAALEPQPDILPSAVDPGRQPKTKLQGADGSNSEVQVIPVGATRSVALFGPTPAGSRSSGPAGSSPLLATPPNRRSFPRLWLYLTVLPLLAILGIVIHVVTDSGTVKITGTDPSMVVRIDGQEIRIENLGEPITLRTGPHNLVVKRGDLVIETRMFQIQRGLKTPLEVTFIPKSSTEGQGGDKKEKSPSPRVADDSKQGTSTTRAPSPKPAPPSQEPQPPSPHPIKVLTNSIGMKLVGIEPGEFMMGSPVSDPDAKDDEKPQHPVRITRRFYLGVYEVTQGQYRAVTGENPSKFKGSDDLPVDHVSWLDAVQFCNRLSELEGRNPCYRIDGDEVTFADGNGYRLPTEAEWEYACRAGSATVFFSGDDEVRLGEFAWFGGNSGGTTHPVGQKKPNAFGLYDMHGNVWEWCWDAYWNHYYEQSPAEDPPGAARASPRVFRGGNWDVGRVPRPNRSAHRGWNGPRRRYGGLGFRPALNESSHIGK